MDFPLTHRSVTVVAVSCPLAVPEPSVSYSLQPLKLVWATLVYTLIFQSFACRRSASLCASRRFESDLRLQFTWPSPYGPVRNAPVDGYSFRRSALPAMIANGVRDSCRRRTSVAGKSPFDDLVVGHGQPFGIKVLEVVAQALTQKCDVSFPELSFKNLPPV